MEGVMQEAGAVRDLRPAQRRRFVVLGTISVSHCHGAYLPALSRPTPQFLVSAFASPPLQARISILVQSSRLRYWAYKSVHARSSTLSCRSLVIVVHAWHQTGTNLRLPLDRPIVFEAPADTPRSCSSLRSSRRHCC